MQQYVDHSYNDYGMVDDDELRLLDENAELLPAPASSKAAIAREKLRGMRCTYGPMAKKIGGVTQPFPCKLLDLLDGSEFSELIDWKPHGRAFLVKKPKTFASQILPHYFKQSKFLSFTRQLNLWGFKRITRGTDLGAYYHELFLRGRPYLAMRMKRQKIKGTGMKLIPNPEAEPNFYEDWPAVPKLTSNRQKSKRRAAELRTTASASPQPIKTLPAERLDSQPIVSLQPIIHNSCTTRRGGRDRLNELLQQHHQLQQQLQQQQQELQQLQHEASATAGRKRKGGQQGKKSTNAENSLEIVHTSSTKDLADGNNVLNSSKFDSGSAIASAGERGGMSTVTTARANNSPRASTLLSQKDVANLSSTQEMNHQYLSLQGQPFFPPATHPPHHHHHPAMSYDNLLQSISSSSSGGMGLFDSASRYCYLEQHHASLIHQEDGRLKNTGGGRVDGGGPGAGLYPNGQVIHDELAALMQSISHYQALATQGSLGIYPPLHQRLSSSDRLLVMERLHHLERAHQRGLHGDDRQDSMNSVLYRARLLDDLASSTTAIRETPPSSHVGGATAADLIHAYHHRVLGLKTSSDTGSPQPPSYSYPAIAEAPLPSSKASSPPGTGRSSTLSNDGGPRPGRLFARHWDDPVVPMDTLREASHLEVLALAHRSNARSLVLADAFQSRSGGIVGAMPTSVPEKSPFIVQHTQNKERPMSPPLVTTAPSQKNWPSLGRPFGRKAS